MKANIGLVLQIIPLAISEYLNKKIVSVNKVILGVTNIFEGGKRHNITSTDLKALKQKVQDKGLIWKKFDD